MTEKIYRVIDIWTKNVTENLTMREAVRTLGVARGTIRSAVKNDNLIRCRYEVSEMGKIKILIIFRKDYGMSGKKLESLLIKQ